MKRKRRHLTAEFKARIAAEAFKGEKSIQEIAQANDIAPSQVSAWKKDLEEHMASIFERKNAVDHASGKQERRNSHLERKIGQLVIEKEFLEKKVRAAGNRSERKAMIDPSDKKLSIRKQAKLLDVNRNRLSPRSSKTTGEDLKIMSSWIRFIWNARFTGSGTSARTSGITATISVVSGSGG
jgi:transposase-like protein